MGIPHSQHGALSLAHLALNCGRMTSRQRLLDCPSPVMYYPSPPMPHPWLVVPHYIPVSCCEGGEDAHQVVLACANGDDGELG